MELSSLVARFDGHAALERVLAHVCTVNRASGAALVLAGEDASATFTFGVGASGAEFNAETPVHASCVVKLYTAALVFALVAAREVALDDEIGELLEVASPQARRYLAGISIRHLLTHTDGIGYRALYSMPVTSRGRIDVEGLCDAIAADTRVTQPGRFCAEGYCGFGLLGALVERRWDAAFGDVVHRELIEPLDAGSRSRPRSPVCPSSGHGFEVTATELGEFLRLHIRPDELDIPLHRSMGPVHRSIGKFDAMFERQADYPGWAPSVTGCAFGWKTFAPGWVGHNGIGYGQTSLVRLHPQKRWGVGVLCMSAAPAAYALLGRLLQEAAPELAAHEPPRLLPNGRVTERADRYVGEYGNKSRRISISRDEPGELRITTIENGQRGTAMLVPTASDGFFMGRPNSTYMWFIQYLNARPEGGFDMLWDIRYLWNRTQ